jgi:lipopolysaccharide export system permease protein
LVRFSAWRPKILDWYILKAYLSTFFFVCIIFSLIAIAVDFSEKLDDMLEREATWREIILDYYLNFVPYINGLLWPLFALISVIFFTSRLANRSEFIAMIGNGVDFYRLLLPYLAGGGILSLILWSAGNYWIPNGNKKRVAFENTYIWKNNFESRMDNIHMNLSATEEIFLKNFSVVDSSGRGFTLVRYDGQKILSKLSAVLVKPVRGEPGRWEMRNWELRTFNGLDERLVTGERKDTAIGFLPEDFIRRDNLRETMTSPELRRFIAEERRRGNNPAKEFEVERFRRTSEAYSILVLTLIGVAVASRKVRGGIGIQLFIGVSLAGLYIVLTKFAATFAIQGGLHPLLGVWVPNLIFTTVALYMLWKAPK